MHIKKEDISFRTEFCADDLENIRRLITSSGIFTQEETLVAIDMGKERLEKGPDSGYEFIFAKLGEQVIGYACFGEIDLAKRCYDLYWLAVLNEYRDCGIGSALLENLEEHIRRTNGRRLYIETSSIDSYIGTRAFYIKKGYTLEAEIKHFYAPNDHKCIYVKAFDGL